MPVAHVLAIAPRIAILAAQLSFIIDHLVILFHMQAYFAASSSVQRSWLASGSVGTGFCQPPSRSMICSASGGPQVFGAYVWTGVTFPSTGSTTAHAASTESSRTKSDASP